jgi:hypothetical protein
MGMFYYKSELKLRLKDAHCSYKYQICVPRVIILSCCVGYLVHVFVSSSRAGAEAVIRGWLLNMITLKVALGQVFSENFGFPCQSTFHLLLHNYLHYHPRLAQ